MIGRGRLLSGLFLDRRVAPVLTVVFVGVLVSTLLAYFSARSTMENLVLSQTRQALGFLDREITSRIEEMTARLILWSREELYVLALEDSYLGESARKEAAKRMVARVRASSFDRVFLIAPDGRIVTASHDDMPGRFSVNDRYYFQQAMNGKVQIETLAAGRHSKLPMLVISAPVRDLDGDVIGVLAVAMETAQFANELPQEPRTIRTAMGYIVAHDGLLLATTVVSPAEHATNGQHLEEIRQAATSGEPALFTEKGTVRVLMAQANARTGWYLVFEADKDDVLRPATRIAWLSGGVSLATLALAALALAALGRAMTGLRQSEEKFSRVFMFAPDSILLTDVETGVVVDVNQTFTTRTGYGRDEVLGRTTAEIPIYVNPDDRRVFHDRLRRDGHVEQFEAEARYKDGSLAISALSGQIVTIWGARYLMTVVRDITEVKRMQEMMIQTEKMISVGGIAAGIAHEINNPLGIVLQAAQNLAQRTRADFRKNQEVAEKLGLEMRLVQEYMTARKLDVFIADIQSAASRASAIIRHMLDFSRRSESRRAVCDIRSIVDNAVNLAQNDYDLKKSYDFKKITLVRDDDMALTAVGCTATEIEQVLLNLLRNAAQALALAQPPVVDPRITIRLRDLPDRLRIEIADNGPGVPESIRNRIFEPFFTTKQPGVGTGLGLSVSYFIVTKGHGGRMTLHSPPEGGAVFEIELPKGDRLEE